MANVETESSPRREKSVRDELVRRLQELRNGKQADGFCGCHPEFWRNSPEKCRFYPMNTGPAAHGKTPKNQSSSPM